MSTPPEMLYPELLAPFDLHAIMPDGHRLDHSEGASKPLRSQPELQPRGAKIVWAHRAEIAGNATLAARASRRIWPMSISRFCALPLPWPKPARCRRAMPICMSMRSPVSRST